MAFIDLDSGDSGIQISGLIFWLLHTKSWRVYVFEKWLMLFSEEEIVTWFM